MSDLEEFDGELEGIDPKQLIDPEHPDEINNFFLVLALVYNDLKGLMVFSMDLDKVYRAGKSEITVHDGEFSGMKLQVNRLVISTVHEFFEFIEANQALIESPRFQELIEKLPEPIKAHFKEMVAVALRQEDKTSFGHVLMRMRNQIGFHYDHKGKNLVSGFCNFFYKNPSTPQNEKAFYALQDSMSNTRFLYADAAAQQYLKDTSEMVEGFSEEMIETIHTMNEAILHLQALYLDSKEDYIPQ